MRLFLRVLLFLLATTFIGCAYRHYMGFHGPSIKRRPDIHAGITKDQECLECHHPDKSPQGPPTSHPRFAGCLKCHNDNPAER
ncbi:MAG: cytochrome c3 family protein [Pseudomonadota bacterium]